MVQFTTRANFWEIDSQEEEICLLNGPTAETVTINKYDDGKIFIDGKAVWMMGMYDRGRELWFRTEDREGLFVVKDDHNPPKPIIEMYRDLGGK